MKTFSFFTSLHFVACFCKLFHLLTIASGLLEVDQCLQRRIRRHKRCG
jgi:hypothetical protein